LIDSRTDYASAEIAGKGVAKGVAMASRKKRIAKVKSSRNKAGAKTRKGAAKRTELKRVKKTARKTRRPGAKRRIQTLQPSKAKPVVQDTIIDVIDEPVPGVIRVTEIEEISVASPDSDED